MKSYTIHKPTHKIFDESGSPAIGLVQIRGKRSAVINRLEFGKIVESAIVQSLGVESLMRGVNGDIGELQFIWRFCFGETERMPVKIECHKESNQ